MLQDMDIEKIRLVTGKSQEAHGMSGMTQDRPEKRAEIGEEQAHPVSCASLPH